MNELKLFLQSNFPTNAAIKLALDFLKKCFFFSEIKKKKKKKKRGFPLTALTRF